MVRERVRQVLSWVLLAAGGVLLAASAVVVQAARSEVAGRLVPWGLAVALLAVAAAVRGACWWARRRAGGVVVGAAWAVTTVLLAQTGPGGDVLLPDDLRSQMYLLGGVAVAVGCVLVRLPARSVPEPAAVGSGAEQVPATAEPEDGR